MCLELFYFKREEGVKAGVSLWKVGNNLPVEAGRPVERLRK